MSLLLPQIKRLTILTTSGVATRFRPNQGQLILLDEVERQFRDRGRARVIILKARQIGFSTMVEAIGYRLCFMFPNYIGLVMAHDKDTAIPILGMTKRYWQTDPFRELYSLKTDSKVDLEWNETGSQLKIATAGNRETGRGTTKRFIHMSEAAFYPDPVSTMNALKNAIHPVPSTFMAIESTANGVGNHFHTEWEMAVARESENVALFFPWHKHAGYRGSAIGIPDKLPVKNEEERVLHKLGISDDQLAWRRWAIREKCAGDLLQFHQEYPTDPEEAFLSTGTNVFPNDLLKARYAPDGGHLGLLLEKGGGVKFIPTEDGNITIYKAPAYDQELGQYLIGADPTRTPFGDYAVAQVINRRTMEQVAVLRVRTGPVDFAKYLYRLGEYYNFAILAPESTGPGEATIGALQAMGYPNLYLRQSKMDRTPGHLTGEQWGWATSLQTKHIAISFLTEVVAHGPLIIHDHKTYTEMKNYVTLPNGRYGNGNGEQHDDTVMALAIAVACHFTDAPLMQYGEDPSSRRPNTSIDLGQQSTAADFAERQGVDISIANQVPGLKVQTDDELAAEFYQDEYDREDTIEEGW